MRGFPRAPHHAPNHDGKAYGEVQPRPPDRPELTAERVAGDNLPYRGIVDHGVPAGRVESVDEAHFWTGRPVEYTESPEEEPVPIPVRVVRGQDAREIRAFSTNQVPLSAGVPSQIAGRNSRRSLLKIRNIVGAAGIVYVGDSNVSTVYGYPLAAGEELTLTATEPVYAVAPTAVVVSVLWEFTKDYK